MAAFLNSPLGSFLKVFLATVLTLLLADLAAAGTFDVLDRWQSWVIAGLVAALPILINWLNPADPRYGRGQTAYQPAHDRD